PHCVKRRRGRAAAVHSQFCLTLLHPVFLCFSSASISATIALIRTPDDNSVTPRRRIRASNARPAESMKFTSARFTTIALVGSAANALSQHFFNSSTHGPPRFPSSTKLVIGDCSLIVILSITHSPAASRPCLDIDSKLHVPSGSCP